MPSERNTAPTMRRTSTTAGGVLLAKSFTIKFLPGYAIKPPCDPKHDLVVQGRHMKLSEGAHGMRLCLGTAALGTSIAVADFRLEETASGCNTAFARRTRSRKHLMSGRIKKMLDEIVQKKSGGKSAGAACCRRRWTVSLISGCCGASARGRSRSAM